MQGTQSLALTIAAIGAGIWALFTFNALRLRDKARAEIERINTELRQQAVVDIKVCADQLAIPDDDSLYLNIEVTLKNVGNRNTHLVSLDSPLSVEEMRWSDDSLIVSQSFKLFTALNYVLRVGNRQKFPYIVRVEKPGLYRIRFAVELSSDELKIAKEAGQRGPAVYWTGETIVHSRIYWTGEKYFVVKPLTSHNAE